LCGQQLARLFMKAGATAVRQCFELQDIWLWWVRCSGKGRTEG